MKKKEIETLIGTLSSPSKMPCHGFSIPASRCKVGSKLAQIPGTVCHGCYALKGRYVFPNVKNAMEKRYQGLQNPDWVFLMATLIEQSEKSGFFRWHDSGDIQDMSHLEKIVAVAEMLPGIKFWLPTREYKIVKDYLKFYKTFPQNLVVRVSGHQIDQDAPSVFPNTSGVTTDLSKATCPATLPESNHKCNDCRACWDAKVKNVNYLKH